MSSVGMIYGSRLYAESREGRLILPYLRSSCLLKGCVSSLLSYSSLIIV